MKRTRHIEIVRYTRWVTWSNSEGEDAPYDAPSHAAAALLLESLGTVTPAPEEVDDCARSEGDAVEAAPCVGRLRRLTSWLRGG